MRSTSNRCATFRHLCTFKAGDKDINVKTASDLTDLQKHLWQFKTVMHVMDSQFSLFFELLAAVNSSRLTKTFGY